MGMFVTHLTACHPTTFAECVSAEAIPPGWRDLVAVLIHELGTVLGPEPKLRILLKSIGARDGGLHLEYDLEPPVENGVLATSVVDAIVAAIRRQSMRTCDACGAPGTLRVLPHGLRITRCESHAYGGSRLGVGLGTELPEFEERHPDASEGFLHQACAAIPDVFVDLTGPDEVPSGWRAACCDLFTDIAALMRPVPGSRLELRRLYARGNRLSWSVVIPPSVPAIVAAAINATFLRTARDLKHACLLCGMDHDPTGCAPPTLSGDPCQTGLEPSSRRSPSEKPFQLRGPRLHDDADPMTDRKPPGIEPVPESEDRTFARAIYRRTDVANVLGVQTYGQEGPDLVIDPGSGDSERHTEHQSQLTRILEDGEAGRWRKLASPTGAGLLAVEALSGASPHLADVVDFVVSHLRAAMEIGLPVRLPPTLLVGPPGIGKTWLLTRIAAALGVPHRTYLMNVATTSDGIGGAHPVWRNASPGLVARTLLTEKIANPIILVDEFDKARLHGGIDAFGPFYTLLEPVGASVFVDDYLQFPIDASAVSWVLSANEADVIPDPIRDRLTIFDVPPPSAEHLAAVVDSIYGEANAAHRGYFAPTLDPRSRDMLRKHAPRSIRVMIAEAMVRAAAQRRREISPQDIVPRNDSGRLRIGFLTS